MIPSETLAVANDLREVPRVGASVEAFGRRAGAGEADLWTLQLAIEELVTNVVTHGYRDGAPHVFTVRLEAEPDRLRAVITDDAPAFDPWSRPEVDTSGSPEARRIGGLGVHLVKKLMDECAYQRADGRNILTIERRLRPAIKSS